VTLYSIINLLCLICISYIILYVILVCVVHLEMENIVMKTVIKKKKRKAVPKLTTLNWL